MRARQENFGGGGWLGAILIGHLVLTASFLATAGAGWKALAPLLPLLLVAARWVWRWARGAMTPVADEGHAPDGRSDSDLWREWEHLVDERLREAANEEGLCQKRS